MTVRLRGHHLLCTLTYVGKGYSLAFTRNYDEVVARMRAGEAVEIVSGPDDICAPLAGDAAAHCHAGSVVERDGRALALLSERTGLPLTPGTTIVPNATLWALFRQALGEAGEAGPCRGCEWLRLCKAVVACGFAPARLNFGSDRDARIVPAELTEHALST